MARVRYSIYAAHADAMEQVKNRRVLLIDNEVQQELLTMEDCIAVMEAAVRDEGLGSAVNRTKSAIYMPGEDANAWYEYVSQEGAVEPMGVVGLRVRSHKHYVETIGGRPRTEWYCVAPGLYGGLVLLFDSGDGALLAILHDGHIQHLRVAAVSAISAKYMARPDAETLGLLGSGGMATTHAWAISTVRNLRQIKVFSPNAEHRERFAQITSEDLGIDVIPCDGARAAVEGSDIVCTCTDAVDPVVEGAWLSPGTHVITAAGSIDEAGLRRVARLAKYRSAISEHYVASATPWRPPAVMGSTRATAEHEAATIGSDGIATLADVVLGRAVGRASVEEITLHTSEGSGVQFAAIGALAYRLAKERSMGMELPLSWFLQDIRS